MDNSTTPDPGTLGVSPSPAGPAPSLLDKTWRSIRTRLLGGLMFALPILITLWVLYWLYSLLERFVIEPLARLVMWKVLRARPDAELPFWFEQYAAPVVGILVVLLLVYFLGFLVHSWLHRLVDWLLHWVPGVSVVYKGVQKLFQTLQKQGDQQERPQRVVLVAFPHPGMKVPGFVTGSCQDIATQKTILCVYVPTTPVPTSGYMLLVPEEEVIDMIWTPEESLQAIISGGLTAPPQIAYFKPKAVPAGEDRSS